MTNTEYTIEDYRNAPSGEGPLASEWEDKPHRLLYDLCSQVSALLSENAGLKDLVQASADYDVGSVRSPDLGVWSDEMKAAAMKDAQRVCDLTDDLRKVRRETILECANVAQRAAWTHLNTNMLGPEQNCVRVANDICALLSPEHQGDRTQADIGKRELEPNLRAENERLKEALVPLAREVQDDEMDGSFDNAMVEVRLEHLRRARSALNGEPK